MRARQSQVCEEKNTSAFQNSKKWRELWILFHWFACSPWTSKLFGFDTTRCHISSWQTMGTREGTRRNSQVERGILDPITLQFLKRPVRMADIIYDANIPLIHCQVLAKFVETKSFHSKILPKIARYKRTKKPGPSEKGSGSKKFIWIETFLWGIEPLRTTPLTYFCSSCVLFHLAHLYIPSRVWASIQYKTADK